MSISTPNPNEAQLTPAIASSIEEPIQITPETPPEVPSELQLPRLSGLSDASRGGAALLCWTGALGSAAGQTSTDNNNAEPTNPCQVQPEDRNQGTERTMGTAETM